MFRNPLAFFKMFFAADRKLAFLLLTTSSFRFFRWLGVHLTPIHFYSPVPDLRELEAKPKIWNRPSELAGINMNEQCQLKLLHKVFPAYKAECDYPSQPTARSYDYYTDNVYFDYPSALAIHSFVRHFRPKRIIEIGAGFSTLAIANACRLNAGNGHPVELIAIDPYPNATLRSGFPGLTQLISKPIQDVDLELLTGLKANDILSIDTSHAVKTGGDVNFLYLEVIPRLAPGVLIHIHDIFFPEEYPKQWLQRRVFWTEQYLLQAFLMHNSAFEIIWAQRFMELRYPADYQPVFSRGAVQEKPGSYSFWMRRRLLD